MLRTQIIRARWLLACVLVGVAGCNAAGREDSSGPTPYANAAGEGGGGSSGTTPPGGSNAGGATHASSVGGLVSTGGASTTRASQATGGLAPTGGAPAAGGSRATGGAAGAVAATGGNKNTGGSVTKGGSAATGGSNDPTGGVAATGGSKAVGGSNAATGGSKASTGGAGAAAGGTKASTGGSTSLGTCSITVTSNSVSSKMATVGIVEWSTTLGNLTSAQIVYTLNNAGSSILNKGGTAPVDLTKTNYHTLLLGLKQSSTYTFHIEATANGTTCKSSDSTLTTGTLSGAPTITRTVTNATAQANGFIVTSGGMSGSGAFIIDADGAIVWYGAAPSQCSRARMDYEGVNMWMMALNVQNMGGEMRYLPMDGNGGATNISGLSSTHHDFCVFPKKIATMSWVSSGTDVESNLLEHASDGSGSTTTVFKIGANLYVGGQSAFGGTGNTFHCNSILYHAADDTYTIGDRNPNLYVKVSHAGAVQWQFGGSCTNAPAGASHCVAESWQVNHGHHYTDDGDMLVFNNGQSGTSHVLEFKLSTSGTMSATSVKDYTYGSTSSNVLGDVQRLPNGNTLVTYSVAGKIIEVDSSWATVQTLATSGTSFGYADWRPTLYGAPLR